MLDRARAGDLDAFEQLYHEHVGRVFALCLRLAGDRQRAEELTQDVFVQVWQRLASFRGESAFASWVHRIAVNVVLTEVRSRRRREARVLTVAAPDALERAREGSGSGPEDGMDLEREIAALPPGARTALVLHDIEGYRHDEIAQLTGVAAGTIRAQLHRARQLLRKRLER
ncbi:MAG TPA: RNA polymerase sigma factor [Gemmatimonadaceae bacterium]|nr:RNA polymerase sigma factor [Gemmatimonadaceae bacterium]